MPRESPSPVLKPGQPRDLAPSLETPQPGQQFIQVGVEPVEIRVPVRTAAAVVRVVGGALARSANALRSVWR